MRLIFKQRFFSWFDSYDIYDEAGNTVFTVQGRLAWGHKLEVYDAYGRHVGTIQEELFRFLPRFNIYIGGMHTGSIRKEFTFFRPLFTLEHSGWTVTGDIMGWDYTVQDAYGRQIMHASKVLLQFTDTYTIDIANAHDALESLMIVLAIDAAKCSGNK